jgi:hypothetical protein
LNVFPDIPNDALIAIVGLAVALVTGFCTYLTVVYMRDAKRAKNPARALTVAVFGITLPQGQEPILCFAHPGSDDDGCIIGVEIVIANIGETIEEDVILVLELSSKIVVGEEHLIRRHRPFVVGKEVQRACENTSEAMCEISYKLPYLAAKTGASFIEPIFLQPTFNRRIKTQCTTRDGVKLDVTSVYSVTAPCKVRAFSKLFRGPRCVFEMASVRASEVEAEATRLATKRSSAGSKDGRFFPIRTGVYILEFPFKKHAGPDGASTYLYQGHSDGQVKCREAVPDLQAIFESEE